MFNLIHQLNQHQGKEKDFIQRLLKAPNELRALIHFIATYVFISTNFENVKLVFCQEMNIESVLFLMNHEASNIRLKTLWLLSNIYADIKAINSEK